jgi:hypothetical protein
MRERLRIINGNIGIRKGYKIVKFESECDECKNPIEAFLKGIRID